MIYQFKCSICDEIFEVVQQMNNEHIAFHCGTKADRVYCLFDTNKDLMYQFDTNIFGKTQTIHSHRQYKRLLKANRLVDATVKECMQVKPDTDKPKRQVRQLAMTIASKMYKDGVSHQFKGYLNEFYTRREKR